MTLATWTIDQLARQAETEAGRAVVCNVSVKGDLALIAWAKTTSRFVYIGRAVPRREFNARSVWANDFGVKSAATAAQQQAAIEAFALHLSARADLQARLPALRGKVLGCWCYPLPCHGDVLAARANARLSYRASRLSCPVIHNGAYPSHRSC